MYYFIENLRQYPVICNALCISFGVLKSYLYRDILPIRQTSVDSSWNDEPDLIFRSKKYDHAIFPVTIKQKIVLFF